MTTNNPIPPHVIEKWRSEYYRELVSIGRSHELLESVTTPTKITYFVDPIVEAGWQGFLLARSTVELQFQPHHNKANDMYRDGFEDALSQVFEDIKAAGYRVAGEK